MALRGKWSETMRLYREMGDADIGQACTDALVEWDL
jgi:hypothetical protein